MCRCNVNLYFRTKCIAKLPSGQSAWLVLCNVFIAVKAIDCLVRLLHDHNPNLHFLSFDATNSQHTGVF